MTPVLGILITLIIFGSLITSFIAIFQILTNDFEDSKGVWILISMIAIIGPILYLTVGRKLIIKKNYEEQVVIKDFSFKNHYLNLIRNLNTKMVTVFVIALSLIIFGYLSRLLNIFIFWESKPIGFAILLICMAIFLRKDIIERKLLGLKNVWSNIGFWIIVFMLFVKTLIMIIIPNTDAYKAAKTYLSSNSQLISEIGEVKGFTVLPNGGIEINGDYGAASIYLIVKGRKKYKELNVNVEKTPNTDWAVKGIE